ncbi:MAG: hypothetical protein JO108_14345 [Acidobacteriaceae bacterium]|nr:hypothetical protein [Acidobacteriaceae bacterium]
MSFASELLLVAIADAGKPARSIGVVARVVELTVSVHVSIIDTLTDNVKNE